MSSMPPHQPDFSGPPGPSPQPANPALGQAALGQPAGSVASDGQFISPDQPLQSQTMATPVDPEIALWPADLPKEPTGWGTLGRVLVALCLFCLPLAGLTAIGHKVGPPTEDFAANSPITIEGATHEIHFDLPWNCAKDLSDESSPTFKCTQDEREVEVAVRPAETIEDLERSARRGAREVTLNRYALDFPSIDKDIQGGKATHVTAGTGLFGINADSLAVSPDADESGFVINITESLNEEGLEPATPEFTEHLLESISLTKIEEGEQ